jgi:hypothetical protein
VERQTNRANIYFAAALLFGLSAFPSMAHAERAYALDSHILLLRFDTNTPSFVESSRVIRGLQPGEMILGIDFRPATGELYGLGSSSRIYTINTETAAATPVGSGPFTPRLEGSEFGFDFNPTVDRIRVVSNSGQNLRLHPETGQVAAVDKTLQYGDASQPNIVASAYTNSVAGATTTMLYGVDSETRNLVTQDPPNDGKLNVAGRLEIDLSNLTGFDISPRTGTAFLVSRVRGANASVLYEINTATGNSNLLGLIEGFDQVSGIAIQGGN